MLLSIIIPLYNNENLIEKCINSILFEVEDYNVEIIVINDGSTDKSLDVLKLLFGNNSKIKIIDKKNTGVSDTRNYGLSIFEGEYLMFVDSDDYIFKNTLKQILSHLSEKSVDLVVFNYKRVYHNYINVEGEEKKFLINDYTLEEYLENHYPSGLIVTQIYNKNVVKNVKFNNSKYYEDIYFITDCFPNVKKIRHFDINVYAYYDNPSSVMNNLNEDFYNNILSAINNLRIKYISHNLNYYNLAYEYLTYIYIVKSIKNKRSYNNIFKGLENINFKSFKYLLKSGLFDKKFKIVLIIMNVLLKFYKIKNIKAI